MSSVNILAVITFPVEKTEDAKQKLAAMLKPSTDESGNISYVMFQDEKVKNCFVFQEVWESMAAFEQHQKTDHFVDLLNYLKLNAESVDIKQLSKTTV